MNITTHTNNAITDISVKLNIFELKRLKDLQVSLESKTDFDVTNNKLPTLRGNELKELVEELQLVTAFLYKVCGNVPSTGNIEKELFCVDKVDEYYKSQLKD